SSTPIRPVFDALARDHTNRNSVSLNQYSKRGLNLIEKIPAILARFRMNRLCIVADIQRAFLQLTIAPENRDYLRFLWKLRMDE
ncbi:hypothetical protein ILUMI_14862, partial [Ignelater luminosus]